jgi:F-type H+-transporting ATPase subunit a
MKIPSIDELFDFPPLIQLRIGSLELSINRIVVLIWLATIITGGFYLIAFRNPKIVPKGIQNLGEAMVDFVRHGIVYQVMGPEGERFVPFLTTLFSFIFVLNVFEITPLINMPVSSRMAIPLLLTLIVYIVFNVVGLSRGPIKYLKGVLFPPGVPWPIYVLVTPIELISVFLIRPVSLAVRLFANMVAGHIILAIFFATTAATFWPLRVSSAFTPLPLAFAVVLVAFELFVSVLQAYVFTILSGLYIADAMHPAH